MDASASAYIFKDLVCIYLCISKRKTIRVSVTWEAITFNDHFYPVWFLKADLYSNTYNFSFPFPWEVCSASPGRYREWLNPSRFDSGLSAEPCMKTNFRPGSEFPSWVTHQALSPYSETISSTFFPSRTWVYVHIMLIVSAKRDTWG